jgi:hypothetical protein
MLAPLPPHSWSAWRFAALHGFALLAPAALPAGGAERRLPEVRRRQGPSEPLVHGEAISLRCEPQRQAPVVARLEPGVPLRLVRHWFAPDGRRWLRVESTTAVGRAGRGWLAG